MQSNNSFSTEVCWGSITLLTSYLMLNIWAWKTSQHSLIFLGRLHGHIYNHSVEACIVVYSSLYSIHSQPLHVEDSSECIEAQSSLFPQRKAVELLCIMSCKMTVHWSCPIPPDINLSQNFLPFWCLFNTLIHDISVTVIYIATLLGTEMTFLANELIILDNQPSIS